MSNVMEQMKRVPLPKFMVSVPWRRLFVSDVAAGTIKLVSGLSGTVSFLQALWSLYDSFGIRAQSTEKTDMSLKDTVNKVSYVNDNITAHYEDRFWSETKVPYEGNHSN